MAGKIDRACLLTYVDRKSRFLKSKKAAQKKSKPVKEATIELLRGEPLHTITPDRGKEFAKHPEISEELDQVQFYFPLPRHPWDRGTNGIQTDCFENIFRKAWT